jgi:5'-nucleotidase
MAGYLDAVRAEAAEKRSAVVVLDAGDMFQGTLVSNQFKGKSVTDVYEALGVTAAAVGNHEFDFGLPVLQQRMAEAKFPILIANAFKKGTRERPEWARPTAMVEVQGLKIGIIGLATQETPMVTNPLNVAELEFAPAGPVAAQLADELRAQGATLVLVAAHAGPLTGAGASSEEAQAIARACGSKIDAIVSGHHHTSIGCCPAGEVRCRCGTGPVTVEGVPVVQSGAKLTAFSVIELDLDAQGHKISQHVNPGTLPTEGGPQILLHRYRRQPPTWHGREVRPSASVAALVARYDNEVQHLRDTRVGSTEVPLIKGGADDLLANLTSDSLRSGAGGGLKARYAFQNNGGLRIAEIPTGPITFGQLFDLTPFDNLQVVVTLKAHEVRDALEAVIKAGKGPLRVSGLSYTVDFTTVDPQAPLSAAPPGKLVPLVVDVQSKQELCKTQSCTATECTATCVEGDYTVALTDFLANGGDGLGLLKAMPRQVSPVLARDILIAYVKEHDPLTPELLGSMRAGGQRRIVQQGGGGQKHEHAE